MAPSRRAGRKPLASPANNPAASFTRRRSDVGRARRFVVVRCVLANSLRAKGRLHRWIFASHRRVCLTTNESTQEKAVKKLNNDLGNGNGRPIELKRVATMRQKER
ncbi:hypothetical protein GE061_005763 [Apolygus lucorum]|uniref:Uncharacterized protein n=1 Tax=Apolygus lucorum TaxID=248454 RepID=A0A8S9X163_APOLU|nr:hypothetical protein GE061_005763 [Apolygus lucorum]